MSLLLDALPTQVGGVPVNTDWRVMARMETRLFDGGLSAEEILRRSLAEFYCAQPPEGFAGWAGLMWFYRAGRPRHRAAGGSQAPRAYDFDEDGELICAAFQQAYRIDLTATAMHWWRFRALMDGLPASCRLSKIIEYRTADTSEMPKAAQEFYARMRRQYALGGQHVAPITREEHDRALIARLRRERM